MKIINDVTQMRELAKPFEWIGFDLETSSLDPRLGKILLASITTPHDTYVIDFTVIDISAAQLIAPLFSSGMVINHNMPFDYKWWIHHTGITIQNPVDIMVNEELLTAGLFIPSENGKPFSLASIAQRRLGKKLNKDVREEFINYTGSLTERAYLYAGEDTEVLKPILDQQMEEIRQHRLERIFELECSLIPVTAYMELTGVKVDLDTLASFAPPIQRYIDQCNQMLQDIFIAGGAANTILFTTDGYSCVNSSSKPQMIEALNALGVNVENLKAKDLIKWDYKNRKNRDAVDYHTLLAVEDEDIADAIDSFGGYQNKYLRAHAFLTGAKKLLESYVLGIIEKVNKETGRFYPWFRQCGARATGRYSSNAQQIPKNDKLKRLGLDFSIRECFVAPKGRKLIIADYPAIELVILADRSGDEKLCYEIERGDVHLVVTREVLGHYVPEAKNITSKNKGERPYKLFRDFSKIISYGIGYGVTGGSLSEQATEKLGALNIVITQQQGDAMVSEWKNLFSDAGKYLRSVSNQAVTKGYTESVLGRKRWFDLSEIASNKWRRLASEREGCNQSIQSSSADMTKLAMIKFYHRADYKKARIILSIHDEIVVESVTSYANTAAAILKECMEEACKEILPRMGHTVIIEPAISDRYDK